MYIIKTKGNNISKRVLYAPKPAITSSEVTKVWNKIALCGVLYFGCIAENCVKNNLSLAKAKSNLGAETIQHATAPIIAK